MHSINQSINQSCLLQPLPLCKSEPFHWYSPFFFFFATILCWLLSVLSSFPVSQSFLSWDFRPEWCKWRKARLTVPLSSASPNVVSKMHAFVTTLSFLIQVYLIHNLFSAETLDLNDASGGKPAWPSPYPCVTFCLQNACFCDNFKLVDSSIFD